MEYCFGTLRLVVHTTTSVVERLTLGTSQHREITVAIFALNESRRGRTCVENRISGQPIKI